MDFGYYPVGFGLAQWKGGGVNGCNWMIYEFV